MADKFWQQSSFKDFVSSIKSGKSSGGDDNPSATPSPTPTASVTGKATAGLGGGTPQPVQPRPAPMGSVGLGRTPISQTGQFQPVKLSAPTQDDVIKLSALFERAGIKIGATADAPALRLNPASVPGSRLFFDPIKGELTTDKTKESYAVVPSYDGNYEYIKDFTDGQYGRYQAILDSTFIYRQTKELNRTIESEVEPFTGTNRVGYLPGQDTPVTGEKLATSYHDATFGRDLLDNISQYFLKLVAPNDPRVITRGTIDKTKFVFKDYPAMLEMQQKYSNNEITLAEFNAFLDENVMPVTPTTKDSALQNFGRWMSESEMIVSELLGVGEDSAKIATGGLFKLLGNSETMRFCSNLNKLPGLLFTPNDPDIKPWSKEDLTSVFSRSPVVNYITEYRKAQRGKLPSWSNLIQKFPEIKSILDPFLGQADEVAEILDNTKQFIQTYQMENKKPPAVSDILKNSYDFQFNNIERTAGLSLSPLSPFNVIEQTKFGYEYGKIYLDVYKSILEMLGRKDEPKSKYTKAGGESDSLSEILDEKVMYQMNQAVFDDAAELQDKGLIQLMGGSVTDVRAGYQAFIDSYKLMDDNLPRSPFVSATTLTDPDKQELAYSLIAQYDIQKRLDTGVPITRSEIKDILDTIADPGVELAWSLIADLKNVLNLPLGKAINMLPDGAVKGFFQTIPNFETKQIDGMMTAIAYQKAIRPLFKDIPGVATQLTSTFLGAPVPDLADTMKLAGKTDIGKAINRMIPIWDAHVLFEKSVNSSATIMAQQSEIMTLMLSGGKRKVLSAEDISEMGATLDAYGEQIIKLKADGKTTSEIIDTMVEDAEKGLPEGKSINLAARRRIESLVLMSETIDPSKQKWSSVWEDSYNNIYKELYRKKLDELIIRAQEQMRDIADPEEIKRLGQEFQNQAKQFAKENTTNVAVASRVGAAFADTFKETHAAWKNSIIMEDTIGGAIGKKFPGSRRIIEGSKRIYKAIKSRSVKNWLMLTGRFTIQQLQENETAYALSHPGGIFAGLIDGVPWSQKWLDSAATGQFLDLSELLVHARSTYKVGLGDDLNVAMTNRAFSQGINPSWTKAMRRNFVDAFNDWLSKTLVENNMALPPEVKFLTEESTAQDIWNAFLNRKKTQKFVEGMIAGEYIDNPTQATKLIDLSKLLYRKMNPFNLWADTTADSTSLLETTYRAKMSYRFMQTNMNKLNPVTFATQANNLRTYMKGAGFADDVTEEIIGGLVKPAWDRAYGNGGEFLKLVNIDEIVGGKPIAATYMPNSVRNMLSPDNMFAAQLIQEMFAGEIESALAKGGQITDLTIDTFFNKVKEVIVAQSEDALNKEGLSGNAILGTNRQGYSISAKMSKMLDTFESGKTLRGVTKLLEDSQDLLDELGIDTAGKSSRQIVSELHAKIRPQKAFVSSDVADVLRDIDANGIENSKYVKKATVTSEGVDEKAFGDRNWEGIIPSGKQAVSASVRVKEIDDRIFSLTKELRDEHNSLTQKLLSNTATDQDRKTIAALERKMESIENTEVRTLTDQELFQGLNIINKNSAASGFGIIPDSPYSRELIKRHPDLSHTEAKAINKIESSSAEPQYTNTLKTILADNGIDIEGKTVQQAIDELRRIASTKTLGRGMTWNEINDTLRMTDIPDDIKKSIGLEVRERIRNSPELVAREFDVEADGRDLARWISNNIRDERGNLVTEHQATSIVEDIFRASDTFDLRTVSDGLSAESGRFFGVLKDFKAKGSTDPVALDMYSAIDSVRREIDVVVNEMDGAMGWYWTKDPAYSLIKNVGHENYQVVIDFKTHYRRNLMSVYRGLREQMENYLSGKTATIYVPNKGEIWGMMGFQNFSIDESGVLKSVDFVNPQTGIKHTYSAETSPYLFTDFMSSSGIFTVDDLNSPIAMLDVADPSVFTTRPYFEFSGEVQPPPFKNSVFTINPENLSREHTNFMRTYLQSEVYGGQPLDTFVRQILAKELLDKGLIYEQLSADDLISELDSLIAKRRKMGMDNQADAIQAIRYRISYPIEYIDSLTNPNIVIPPPIALSQFPEELQTWIQFSASNSAMFENMMGALDEWQKLSKDALSNNSFVRNLTLPENISMADLKTELNKAAKAMNEMYDMALYGGNMDGIEIEGAVPHMNLIMKDYATSATVFDEAMKNIYWFWMFPTRGAASWARLIMDKPMIVAYYDKYMRYGRHQAYEQGAVDSRGRPYAAFAGKFSIGNVLGTNVWIDALAGSPFLRYFMRPNRAAYSRVEEQESKDPILGLIDSVVNEGSLYGLRLGTTAELIVRAINKNPDPYTGYNFAETLGSSALELLPIPKDLQDAIMQTAFRMLGQPRTPKLWDARVTWFDSLVEEQLYKDMFDQISNATSEEEVREIVSKYVWADDIDKRYSILTDPDQDREAYELWNDASWRVTLSDTYSKNLVGYVTSFYPRYWSEESLEINNLRNRINFLKETANNKAGLQLFTPDLSAQEMYKTSNDSRFRTPEGWVYNIRNATRFVRDEKTGELITDPEQRRKAIAADLTTQFQTDAYYATKGEAVKSYHEEMRLCDISGASSGDPCIKQARANYINALRSIEDNPQYQFAEKPYFIGNKPEQVVMENWEDYWFDILRNTRPVRDRDNNESYDEFEKRLKKWERELPSIAQDMIEVMTPVFARSYNTQTAGQELNYDDISKKLLEKSNIEGFTAWERSRDNIFMAIARAYDELFYDGFMRILDTVRGTNSRNLAIQNYTTENPVPTTEQLLNKTIELYGDERWTPAEINAALTNPSGRPREVLPAQESLELGRTDDQNLWDEAWTYIGWSLPGSSTKLKNEFVRLGGHPNDWDKLYTSQAGGKIIPMMKWETEGGFERIPQLLKQAAMNLEMTAPTGADLVMKAQAEQANEQFKKMAVMQLGEGILEDVDMYGAMSTAQRRQMKSDDPERYQRIQMYYKLKDQFAAQNLLFKEFYASGGGTKYYGYGGRSGGRSGGKSVARTSAGFVPIGMRSTQDANTLLAPENLGKGGVAGMPKLPTQFWEKTTIDLRSEIYRFVNGDAQLSKAAVGFLTRQADRYPEYKPEIDKLLAEEEVTVT